MNLAIALLLALLLAAWWRGGRGRRWRAADGAHGAAPAAGAALWPEGDLSRFEACPYCAPRLAAAQAEVAAFQAALPATRAPGAGEAAVRALFRHRAAALREMHEVRMRLPNDLALERRWAALTEALDASLLDLIEDARQRCAVPLVHPGPVDDAWYGAWYRAANDRVA